MKPTDSDLLRGLLKGEESAFEEIFVNFYPSLCLYTERFLNHDLVGDVVEDVFLKLWTKPVKFESLDHLKAYLYQAVRNGCLNLIKREDRLGRRQFNYLETQKSTEEEHIRTIIHAESFRLLHLAMQKLPNQAKKIIDLTYLQGKSNQEVADMMNLSINTVKFQKRRGVMLLKGYLGENPLPILLALSLSSDLIK